MTTSGPSASAEGLITPLPRPVPAPKGRPQRAGLPSLPPPGSGCLAGLCVPAPTMAGAQVMVASPRVVQGPGHLGPSASSMGTRQVCGVRAWLRAGAVGAEQGVEAGGQIQVSGRPGLRDTGRLRLSRLPSTGLPPSQHAAPAWPGWDGAATSVVRPVLGCVTLGCSLTSLSPP